jgi:hypothetical protein
VIRSFTTALESEDVDKVEALRRSVTSRIDQLEEFYLENDGGWVRITVGANPNTNLPSSSCLW